MNNMQGFALQVFKYKEDDELLSCGMHLALIAYTWRNHAHIQTHTHTGVKVWKREIVAHGADGRRAMCHHPLEETPDTRAVGARVSSGQMGSSLQRGPSRQRRLISQAHYPSSTRSRDLPCSALATLSFRVRTSTQTETQPSNIEPIDSWVGASPTFGFGTILAFDTSLLIL